MTALTEMNRRRQETARAERDYLFGEARWLMSFGTHPDRIAHQLGTTRRSLYDRAHKWGARDVADYVAPDRSGERRPGGVCGSCGVPTSARTVTSCRDCSLAKRFGRAA